MRLVSQKVLAIALAVQLVGNAKAQIPPAPTPPPPPSPEERRRASLNLKALEELVPPKRLVDCQLMSEERKLGQLKFTTTEGFPYAWGTKAEEGKYPRSSILFRRSKLDLTEDSFALLNKDWTPEVLNNYFNRSETYFVFPIRLTPDWDKIFRVVRLTKLKSQTIADVYESPAFDGSHANVVFARGYCTLKEEQQSLPKAYRREEDRPL